MALAGLRFIWFVDRFELFSFSGSIENIGGGGPITFGSCLKAFSVVFATRVD